MKKTLFIASLIMSSLILQAGEAIYLWPVKDVEKGQGILFKPQTYVGNELNSDALIISAAFGSFVVSPVDGILDSYLYTYNNALNMSTSYRIDHTNYGENVAQILKENTDLHHYSQYIGVTAGIKLKSGKTLYVQGLRPIKSKKTGQFIKQGDTLGTLGFFYNKIDSPCIAISISENGKIIDPLPLFGLKSNFISYTETIKDTLTKKQVQEDFRLFFKTMEECYPGIYTYNTPEEIKTMFGFDTASLRSAVSLHEFGLLMAQTIRKLGDCHLQPKKFLFPMKDMPYNPSVSIGYLNDSLIVTRTINTQMQYLGKRVYAVDDISPDSLRNLLIHYMFGMEAYVQSYPLTHLLSDAFLKYFIYSNSASPQRDLKLTFEDKKTVLFPGAKISSKMCVPLLPNWREYALINRQLCCKIIMSKLAYIGIPSFDLKETEMDKIRAFIKKIQALDSVSLIIDVRNNGGGESDRVLDLFSYIAQDTFSPFIYEKVNKKGGYNFCHVLNYEGISSDVFLEYDSIVGEIGFYRFPRKVNASRDTNFKGKIYVLTNEHTFSAATELAILVRKYHRGIIVGRETGSSASVIHAMKFADLRLPNSGIVIQIPLVKIIYNEVAKTDSLYGRGLIPDFMIPISLDELSTKNGDAILNQAIRLATE